jgi:hypothetical protein
VQMLYIKVGVVLMNLKTHYLSIGTPLVDST